MLDDDRSQNDFKNQLVIIRGFAEILLADSTAADPHRSELEEIYNATVSALDLFERLYPHHAGTSETVDC